MVAVPTAILVQSRHKTLTKQLSRARIAKRFQKLLKALFFCPAPNMTEAPSNLGASLVSETPHIGKLGGRVLGRWGYPQGESRHIILVLCIETILHPTSSLDGLLERLPPEPHLRGEEFERAAKGLNGYYRLPPGTLRNREVSGFSA